MNLNEFNFTPEDKAYMIVNSASFPLDIATNIRINDNIWKDELTKLNSIGILENEYDKLVNIRNSINDNIEFEQIKKSLFNLLNSQVYTDEDINKLFKDVSNTIILAKSLNIGMNKLSKIILYKIIPHKLYGNNIYYMINKPIDIDVNKSLVLIDLMQAFTWCDNTTYALCIFIMISLLLNWDISQIDTNKEFIGLMKCYCYIKDIEYNQFIELLKLYNGIDNFIEYLDKCGDKLPDSSYVFLNTLYNKDDDNKTILSSDNNKQISPIIKQFINTCTIDLLKEYVGDYNGLSFIIPESISGYVLSKTDLPINKIFIKGKGMYTLVNMDDINYVLFVTPEKPNRCFGLQCDTNNDDLKLLTIKLPIDKSYQLS